MESIQIKNLRSLMNTGEINIKPITILVGKNSSGKSTFIRTFPLFKQSSQVKKTQDLLWYGPLVDFGSFQESVCKNTEDNFIEFSMKCLIKESPIYFYFTKGKIQQPPILTEIIIQIRKPNTSKVKPETTYIIKYRENDIVMSFSDNWKIKLLKIGALELTEYANKVFYFHKSYGVIPSLGNPYSYSYARKNSDDEIRIKIINNIKPYADSKLWARLENYDFRELSVTNRSLFTNQLLNLSLGKSWKAFIRQQVTENTDYIQHMSDLICARDFNFIIEGVSDYLTDFFGKVQYINPMRATAERYYRIQGLSVDEIDSQGRNLSMFLSNLSEKEIEDFAQWTSSALGAEIRPKITEGHVSIILVDPKNKTNEINLADSGFGYSQVLPILAQLWQVINVKQQTHSNAPYYFVIEQPELHLHPRMQANLANIFSNIIHTSKKQNLDFRLVIETHSEAIINQIGYHVEKNKLISKNDVVVYIFEKETMSENTTIKISNFDNDGMLANWPYGFFDAGW
jgi:predicted ATPase